MVRKIKPSRLEPKQYNRIELKSSPRTYLRDMYSVHNTIDEAFETGKRVQLFHDQEQICQLFPQPLDDKELREKIARQLHKIERSLIAPLYDKTRISKLWEELTDDLRLRYELEAEQDIIPLLQPKIEEAKREVAKEIFRAYDAYVRGLEEENGSLIGLAYSHGWCSSQIEFGKECRSKIKSLKSGYKGQALKRGE